MSDEKPNDKARGVTGDLAETIRAVVREELARLAGEDGSSPTTVAAVIASPELHKQVNAHMEAAFQTVLPQLIKRFKKEVEERLQTVGGTVNAEAIAGSEKLKELLDARFRQMVLYLKQDVIPRSIDQRLSTPQS